jgi:short-subunit dehydrogenase
VKVFITGASSGIGAALAMAYAARGDAVGLIARREPELRALMARLPAVAGPGPSHFFAAVDVLDYEALERAATAYMAHAGVPDIVIANAGISMGTRIGLNGDTETLERILRTNVVATAATFAPFVLAMRNRAGARLVTIASVAGVRGLPGSGAYCASKAAVIALTESLRVELFGAPLRVVTLAPGFIATPMTAHNPYPMPFLMPVERFAAKALKAIDAGVSYRVIPWPMGWVAKVLRLLPNALYDRAFSRAAHKPRQTPE